MRAETVWLVKDLIEKNKRIFKIPVYQRNYDWKILQCNKLFDDVIVAFQKDSKHFTGTIVYLKTKSTSVLDEDLIIDGQQRITTIFIFLKALHITAKAIHEDNVLRDIEEYMFNRNCDEVYKLKLKPVKNDNTQFLLLMKEQFEEIDKSSNIYLNFANIKKRIEEEIKNGLSIKDILNGLKKLEIVEIILDSDKGDNPQNIFESINSTGLDLSIADLIRNFLLMDEPNQECLFEEYWQFLEKELSNENMTNFFVDYLNFKTKDIIKGSNVYDRFKNFYFKNNFNHEMILKDMKKYAKFYRTFIKYNDAYSVMTNKYLSELRLLKQTTCYTFLLSVFEDYQNNVIDNNILENVLKVTRNYIVRRLICSVPSNSLSRLFVTIYSRLFKNDADKKDYILRLSSFLAQLNTKDKFPSDIDIKQNLFSNNLYQKSTLCKFLLSTIENDNYKEKIYIEELTIEHIMPQKLTDIWKEELGNDYLNIHEKYLNVIGNLSITGYNSSLGNKPFFEKKSIIYSYSKMKVLNADILNQVIWNEKTIINRTKILTEKVISIFKNEESSLIFFGNNEQKKNFDDIETIYNRRPESFVLLNTTTAVSTYVDILIKSLEMLVDLDYEILIKLAKDKFRITNADNPYISLEQNELRRPKEIKNSGIYIESNLSSKYILLFLKEIIRQYDLDDEDFYFIVNPIYE